MASHCCILFFQTEGNEKKSETNKYSQARFARPWRKWRTTSVALLAIRRTNLILYNTPTKGSGEEKGKEGSWQTLRRDVSSHLLKGQLSLLHLKSMQFKPLPLGEGTKLRISVARCAFCQSLLLRSQKHRVFFSKVHPKALATRSLSDGGCGSSSREQLPGDGFVFRGTNHPIRN